MTYLDDEIAVKRKASSKILRNLRMQRFVGCLVTALPEGKFSTEDWIPENKIILLREYT